MREALTYIAREGESTYQAAKRAGISSSHMYRSLERPEIREILDNLKAQYSLEMEQLKGMAKAFAYETGLDLMRNAKSEAVRARMVEFFAGEAKQGAQVNVQINNNGGGYEYVQPGATVYDIKPPAPDRASSDDED